MSIESQIGIAVLFAFMLAIPSRSQSTPATPTTGSTPSTPSPAAAPAASGGATFSIEAEMFGYKSLQSDSEAIACDVAQFLSSPASLGSLPQGPNALNETDPTGFARVIAACTVIPASPKGVVIVSSLGTTISNYQLWRANLVIMKQLIAQANGIQPPPQPTGAAPPDLTGSLTEAGQVVTVVQGLLGLFASNQSASTVTGTIQDQALMNGVARQLRNLKVPVLMPDTYAPRAISGIDFNTSPFLKTLVSLIVQHTRLQKILAADQTILNASTKLQSDRITLAADQEKLKQTDLTATQKQSVQDEILKTNAESTTLQQQLNGANVGAVQQNLMTCQSLVTAIEAFLANLTGGSVTFSAQSSPTPAPAAPSTGSTPAPATPAPTPVATSPSSPATSGAPPPIIAVLAADGLAQSIGATSDSLEPSDNWRLLWLKALESGGALITESNILGSKVHFSGGAVATFSLFKFDGSLSCSGNAMAYGGYLEAKKVKDKFDSSNIDPRKQLIYLRGSCAAE